MVGENTGYLLGVTDNILTHAEIKHYTNVRIHNEYTLASTVFGLLGITKPTIIEKIKLYHLIQFFFSNTKKGQFDTIFC
jgi:hypothetical protein